MSMDIVCIESGDRLLPASLSIVLQKAVFVKYFLKNDDEQQENYAFRLLRAVPASILLKTVPSVPYSKNLYSHEATYKVSKKISHTLLFRYYVVK